MIKPKKIGIVFAGIIMLSACHNKNNSYSGSFELSGKLTGGGEGIPIYLERITREKEEYLDSAKLAADGSFVFHTKGIYKGFYVLKLSKSDFATLILDSTEKVHIEGNSQFLADTYTVTGSDDSKLFVELNRTTKDSYMKRDSIQKLYNGLINAAGGNKKRLDSLNDAAEGPYDTIVNRHTRYLENFIKTNTDKFASIAAIEQLKDELGSEDKSLYYYTLLDNGLMQKYPSSPYVKVFHDEVEGIKRVATGANAPEISLPDTNGKIVTLSSLRGKVVLVDFWASWCAPCQSTLPGLVTLYDKYKNKNFTILSVSLDKDKAAWLDGIHKFHLKWTQVSDLKYRESKVVSDYNFRSMPFSVLVSADGKIVDKNMSEADLDKEIAELLKDNKL